MAKAWPTQPQKTTKTDLAHAKASGENKTAWAKNKLATDLTRQAGAERPEEQKIILQNGRKAIVTVEYIGEECIICDVKDPLLREKLSFKIGIIKIMQSF